MAPLFRNKGVAGRRERPLLLAALLTPFFLFLLPEAYRTPFGIAATIGIAVWLLRGATLRLHGAEHRAIAATEAHSLVATWHGDVRPTRSRTLRNELRRARPAGHVPGRPPLEPLAPELWTPVAVTAVSLAATMELWRAVQTRSALRVLLLPGLGLQRLTTREPRLTETRTALPAAASVLQRELA